MSFSEFTIRDNSKIAVIGGGPSGSLFTIFALKYAAMLDRRIEITIFEPKDFTSVGPSGCNHCGGVISELLVQILAVEGINIPTDVVQRGVSSYVLHTQRGDVRIQSPSREKRIATVFRGAGPKGTKDSDKTGFDDFLIKTAVGMGARHLKLKVDSIRNRGRGKPVLASAGENLMEADLVVGAFGINSSTWKIFEKQEFGYKKPLDASAFVSELELGRDELNKTFGDAIHFFLLPQPDNIKFAALIPKGNHVTLCILGKGINKDTVDRLLDTKPAFELLHGDVTEKRCCQCYPKLAVSSAKCPFTDRIVAIGDAGSTRLFKDGIGASYRMGKSAAKTALFHGVSRKDFREHYWPVYRGTAIDNTFGRCLYLITDGFKNYSVLTDSMLEVVSREQARGGAGGTLSSILWDTFTGNAMYRDVFFRGMSPGMNAALGIAAAKSVLRRFL